MFRWLLGIVLLCLGGIAAVGLLFFWLIGRALQTTDDEIGGWE